MDFKSLEGKTLTEIIGAIGDDKMIFVTDEGEKYKLFHELDCSELVLIEDIIGDANDLIGSPVLLAEEVTHEDVTPAGVALPAYQSEDSFTWTFYKLSTIKGSVTIRWYGESNGYYSESVDFEKIKEK